MIAFMCFFALLALTLGQETQECGDFCTANYSPVCCSYDQGTFKTFSNACNADITNCKKKTRCESMTNGPCDAESLDKCEERVCADVKEPVCCTNLDGSAPETYENTCEAFNAMCARKKRCYSLEEGECEA
ncbi:agrin-like [Phlebotomus argentipes]|uniref:agrin-like n=1 Tax=Phlebotomus argentipes TaxID=94469 RepID=UPI0028931499|nr:agrin-like [Phlebotomus argentipes]